MAEKEEVLEKVRQQCAKITEERRAFAERLRWQLAREKAERIRRLHEPPGPVDQVRRAAAHLAYKVTENAVLRMEYICAAGRRKGAATEHRSPVRHPSSEIKQHNRSAATIASNGDSYADENEADTKLWQMLAKRDCPMVEVEQVFHAFRAQVQMRDAKTVWDTLAELPGAEIIRPVIPRQGSVQLQLSTLTSADRGYCLLVHPSAAVADVTLVVGGRVNLQIPLRGNGCSHGKLPYRPAVTKRKSFEDMDYCLPGWGDAAPVWCLQRSVVTLTSARDDELQLTLLALRCPSLLQGVEALMQAAASAAHNLVVHAENETGMPALTFAALHGNLSAVRYLLAQGASVNHRTKICRSTPLHEAVRSCNLPLVQLLVQSKAKLHSTDRNGDTPLHIACRMNNLPAARILATTDTRRRAANTKNQHGHLPVDCIPGKRSTTLAELVRSKKTCNTNQANGRAKPS